MVLVGGNGILFDVAKGVEIAPKFDKSAIFAPYMIEGANIADLLLIQREEKCA